MSANPIPSGIELSRKARAVSMPALLRRLRRDSRGIAAVEFAILMPLLLALYFGSVEVMQAVDTNRKLSRVSAQIADLVSQNINISKADIDAIMNIGAVSLSPYNRSTPDIRITAVRMSTDAVPTTSVLWRRNRVGGAFTSSKASSDTINVPAPFRVRGQVVIMVETSLDYELMLSWDGTTGSHYGVAGFFNGIPMNETYYFRPRTGDTVSCSDC